MATENLTQEEQILELGLKDFTDIIFDPTDPVDYASMAAGPMGKGIVAIGKVQKLMDKLAMIQKQRRKYQAQLERGMANRKVGMESNYQPDIKAGENMINSAQKNLTKIDEQEKLLKAQLPKGQIEMDFNTGGVVSLMPLKY
jgi:hypothetical protein|tara:strand:- start:1970 stop:2395 length:426 start_codon:yes stop_codon:yes gene_type:complete